jgi:hypothetical protein
MVKSADSAAADNVIYLFGVPRKDRAAPGAGESSEPGPCQGLKEQIFFIRAGTFQCMINGAVGVVRAGEFVRVGHGTAHAFVDVGPRPGLMFARAFPIGVDARLLNEIAAAIPASAQEFPRPGSAEFCALCTIAKRWGVQLEEHDAA